MHLPFSNMTEASTKVVFHHQQQEHHHDELLSSYPPISSISMRSNSNSKTTVSMKIPINRESIRKTASEHQMAADEAEAEYKDYVFFSRVIDGMSRQNSVLQDGSSLKSTNESLIDHLVKSRIGKDNDDDNDEKDENDQHHHEQSLYYYRTNNSSQLHEDFKIVTPVMNLSPLPTTRTSAATVEAEFEHITYYDDVMTSTPFSHHTQDEAFDYYEDDQANEDDDDDGGIFDLEL